ncbi:MAG: hypothetical protein KBC73_22010 [Burkholderiaceae bacterium]|nr:hypothetical protein [Burkholderiaceae bacterium]
MSLLTDIAITHTYKGKKSPDPVSFTLHPFQNSTGTHIGRYEVLRDIEIGSRTKKRSAHLTKAELAELYARGLHEKFSIRLRLRPQGATYPDAPPGKKVPSHCILRGSDFARLVAAVDPTSTMSGGLRNQLARIGLNF